METVLEANAGLAFGKGLVQHVRTEARTSEIMDKTMAAIERPIPGPGVAIVIPKRKVAIAVAPVPTPAASKRRLKIASTREAVLRDFARGAQPCDRLAKERIATIKRSTPPTISKAIAAVAIATDGDDIKKA